MAKLLKMVILNSYGLINGKHLQVQHAFDCYNYRFGGFSSENVDRLIKLPAKQRGRDFGIMLRCLADLGYAVEWRVINAAEYGLPQRRRRTYIFAYIKNTNFYKTISKNKPLDVLTSEGIFAKAFPIVKEDIIVKEANLIDRYEDVVNVSNDFKFGFENTGFMIDGIVYTAKTKPVEEKPITLGEIAQSNVDTHYYLNDTETAKFKYLRGSKKIPRVDANGFEYIYSEGAMSEYDDLSEETEIIRKLACQEVGQDKINLINESKLMIKISQRIKSNL